MDEEGRLVGAQVQRLCRVYGLTLPATFDEVMHVCMEMGVGVLFSSKLARPGYYVAEPEPLIVVRPEATVFVLSHELWHHVSREQATSGIAAAYTEEGAEGKEEEEADLFASLLTG